MARTVRNAKLDTRSARASSTRLRKAPYWHAIAPGFALGYRKASKGGVWLAKLVKPGLRKETTLGPADDALNPDGVHIFSFAQAQEKARDWKARVENEHVGGPKKKLITVGEAIDSYEADLKARGGHVGNVGRLRVHVTGDMLDKAVAALTWDELREWRDGLVKTPRKKRKAAAPPEKLSPAAINRTCAAFKAALNRVADDPDQHIPSRHAWEHGLESIPDAEQARNVILSDSVVLQITADSYKTSAEFGLFIEIHAVTGARPDQIRKLTVYDLQADRPDPRLMMPPSKKGKKGITKKPCPVRSRLNSRSA